jgi:hypothetical protein
MSRKEARQEQETLERTKKGEEICCSEAAKKTKKYKCLERAVSQGTNQLKNHITKNLPQKPPMFFQEDKSFS